MTQAPRASVSVSWMCLQGIGSFQLCGSLPSLGCSQSQNILLKFGGGVLVGLPLLPTAYLHQGFTFGALPPYSCPLAPPSHSSIPGVLTCLWSQLKFLFLLGALPPMGQGLSLTQSFAPVADQAWGTTHMPCFPTPPQFLEGVLRLAYGFERSQVILCSSRSSWHIIGP